MSTLTLNIEDNLLQQANIYAASKGISLTQMVKEYLTEIIKTPDLDKKQAILKRYSQDELGRKEAMALLGVDYGELIVMMANNHLPLPSLPEPEIKAMAATFSKIWRESQ
jgi:hypothetical protein